ncbi:uncharacterized protein L969DRAFT_49223 [Mixia osmundae IAM 14324]|uniref:Transmembrane protein 135 N-terminal domain-containing protein n=1 Tax=Mixia osmundae (strain CBS 9802 / IAM 14324 / JCM 22182 / KY 12970) TaxID=764103 RepID=G7E3E4_MIXOS|nr:uncharacterized protein L969DRAFT_49223 [Mixia osmundae IAM 14324]KEI39340.1 hypothetical protein L969DRAFT_49223 [Mixia osmundae IAM 14324]GAA97354.1 hypothetical protein E5Q_04032 [Mixia osmundae IAM 14324]
MVKPLDYILTPGEAQQLTHFIAARGHQPTLLKSLSSEPTEHDEVPFKTDDDYALARVLPAVSRRTLRIFAFVFAATSVTENALTIALKRRWPTFKPASAMRLALFVASYSAVYRLSLRYLLVALPKLVARRYPRMRGASVSRDSERRTTKRSLYSRGMLRLLSSPYLPPALAGLLAGPTILLDASGQRRITVVLYALTRSIQAAYDGMIQSEWLPATLRERRLLWGGHILFALCNAQLLHAFVFHPDCFPKAYSDFILGHSKVYIPSKPAFLPPAASWPTPRETVNTIAKIASDKKPYPAFDSPLLHPEAGKSMLPADGRFDTVKPILDMLAHPGHTRLVSAILHPAEPSGWETFKAHMSAELPPSLRFMSILSGLGMLLRYKKVLRDPENAVYSFVTSTLGGSIFLSGAIGSAWASIDLFGKYLSPRTLPKERWYLQGFLAGLFVLFQRNRATDLAIYTARLSIQSAWQIAVKRRRVKPIPNGEAIYFALSTALLMALFEVKPKSIRSGLIQSLLTQIIGPSKAASKPQPEETEEGESDEGSQ